MCRFKDSTFGEERGLAIISGRWIFPLHAIDPPLSIADTGHTKRVHVRGSLRTPLPTKTIASLGMLCLLFTLFQLLLSPAIADLRTPAPPGWWDPDTVGSGQDWHYRVPVTLPSTSSVNSTAKVDIDFATLGSQLGISGTLDLNSIRVVRPVGTLATVQEYTDTIYAGATDGSGNNRGEIRWIVEDGGAQTYYIYFDITQNGVKSANPQSTINANFEHSTTGQQSPVNWVGSKIDVNFDAQVRPDETVSVTDSAGSTQTQSTNGSANSGSYSYLLGARTNAEAVTGVDATTLTRTFTVPSSNPGNLTVRWKPQGWDSSTNAATSYDFIRIDIVGSSTTEIVGPTAGNYATYPFSPNMSTNPAAAGTPGYGQYNGWDMGTSGGHTAGMSVALHAEPWWTQTVSLASYAGQTVTVRFRTAQTVEYRSWYLIDDMEWSVVSGTLGTAEAFGAVFTSPSGTPTLAPGQKLSLTARIDAKPTAASLPVTANVYDNTGTLVASAITLFNDGTHGDATANDAIWTNDGSDTGNPTYTIPLSTANSSGWTLRLFAKDASTSTIGAPNGLVHRNSLPTPQIEANYWNIDDMNFSVAGANLSVTKTSTVISDGHHPTNPKAIPGALVRYCILVTNGGTATATDVAATDTIPSTVSYVTGSMKSGTSCAGATTAEDDDNSGADESDPYGASISGTTITGAAASLANGISFALVFDATIN